MERAFEGYLFSHVCQIVPEQDEHKQIKVFFPQERYAKRETVALHAFGSGPFCRFQIPARLYLAGVYILTVDNMPQYVGECVNLSNRYNTGYGNISPKNCYKGGRTTNCRINNLIYHAAQAGQRIDLWFYTTPLYKTIEGELIEKLEMQQRWNRKR